jgi:phytol kinase
MIDLIGAAVLLLLFLAVIGAVELITRRGYLEAETARKSIHVCGGLGCLLFPLLVSSWITVLSLALIFAALLYIGENRKMLKALSKVERKSCGSLLFPIAILVIFILSDGRLWLYVSSLLVLVLADTAAALAGTRFGSVFYNAGHGEKKSLEGTVIFGIVGFLSVFLPLLTLSDIPPVTCLLTALLMALLLAGLEAVSIGGTDNLLVPLGTCYLLFKLPTKPQPEILFQCLSLITISIGLSLANKHYKTLRTRSLIIFILLAFSAWALGSAEWMIPVIIGFFAYGQLCSSCAPLPSDLAARVLLRPMYPPLFILFIANTTMQLAFWFAPFIIATSVTSSLCVASRFRRNSRRLSGIRLLAAIVLPITVSLLLCLPFIGEGIGAALLIAPVVCGTVSFIYLRVEQDIDTGFLWSYAITFHSAVAAILYAGLQYAGVIQPLEPSTWMEVFR